MHNKRNALELWSIVVGIRYYLSPVIAIVRPLNKNFLGQVSLMNLEFSRRLAMLGVIPPIADTIRRWHQLGDMKIWPFWLDDFFLGGFLIYSAWLTKKDAKNGRRFLSAAWGFACGMVYLSFFEQITSLDKPDPAPISSGWVAVIKGLFFLLAILGLIGSLWGNPRDAKRL